MTGAHAFIIAWPPLAIIALAITAHNLRIILSDPEDRACREFIEASGGIVPLAAILICVNLAFPWYVIALTLHKQITRRGA